MEKAIVLMVCVGVGIVLIFFKKPPKKLQVVPEVKKQMEPVGKNERKQIRIRVECSTEGQINIVCYDCKEKRIANLYAHYALKDDLIAGHSANTVHLEQIYVAKNYRRRGLATVMFQYLLEQMERVEKAENLSFRMIYGEIGKGGSDDPRLSIPFYERLDGVLYGKDRKLSYERKIGTAMDGLDRFVYYITKT